MIYPQGLYLKPIRDLTDCLTVSGYEAIGHLKLASRRKKWCIRLKDSIPSHVHFLNKCSEGSLQRMQLSSFGFAAKESHISTLMGNGNGNGHSKGEAAARRELMELHGNSVEVDV